MTEKISKLTDEELIARYIEPNPHYPWLDEARLVDYGVSVWALVGDYKVVGDAAQVAARRVDRTPAAA